MKSIFKTPIVIILMCLCMRTHSSNVELESSQSNCMDPCGSCQKTVYLLKFQQLANCESKACRNTCFKVKEQWSIDYTIYEGFKKDLEGKCEICFRAGFCSMEQCSEQKKNELEVIRQIVESAPITARVDGRSKEFPNGRPVASAQDIMRLQRVNGEAIRRMKHELNTSQVLGTANNAIGKMKNLFKNYFKNPMSVENINSNNVFSDPAAQNLSPYYDNPEMERFDAVLGEFDSKMEFLKKMEHLLKKDNDQVSKEEKLKYKGHLTKFKQQVHQNLKQAGVARKLIQQKLKSSQKEKKKFSSKASTRKQSNVDGKMKEIEKLGKIEQKLQERIKKENELLEHIKTLLN